MNKSLLIKENEKENFKINESNLTYELENFLILINSFPKIGPQNS